MLEKIILLFSILCFALTASAQSCDRQINGQVIDEHTGVALSYAQLYLDELGQGALSDSAGYFSFTELCPGDYHLVVDHIGCSTERFYLELRRDTQFVIELHHHTELLDEILVHGSKEGSAAARKSINETALNEQSNTNLATILTNIAGVSSIKNGSGIAKPVIHGLYGNRVAILNNGIAQSGQQWGNDHAPEIDPLVAEHVTVVKGASTLAYNGSSLGGVVLVEPGAITREPHLHGKANYSFTGNGRGHTANVQLEQYSQKIGWRATGTFKRFGDRRTPDYFLTNTGGQEMNFALQLEKQFSERWTNKAYYSLFTTELGILRAAHIGNLTDLETALTREEPFFTNPDFSYAINAPRQKVRHHLWKLDSKYALSENKFLHLIYGAQLNDRQEFDVRRGGRSETPSLSLKQWSQFAELNYKYLAPNNWNFKTGLQFNYVLNDNAQGTGVLPLIPDYNSQNLGAFAVVSKTKNRLFAEAGARLDFRQMEAITITRTLPRRVERFDHSFQTGGFSAGAKYELRPNWTVGVNSGWQSRNPEINELYSQGLHQGVGGIEYGDATLGVEQSFKTSIQLDGNVDNRFFFQVLGYHQRINDYLFLRPEQEFELTIRGAFPVFRYSATDARIQGVDVTTYFQPNDHFRVTGKYAYLRGDDLTDDQPLVFMPANSADLTLKHTSFVLQKIWSQARETDFELGGRYVFEQHHLNEDQDFLPPPDGYFLMRGQVTTHFQFSASELNVYLRAENVFNSTYRDYLNRLRYFADEEGRNVVIGLTYSW